MGGVGRDEQCHTGSMYRQRVGVHSSSNGSRDSDSGLPSAAQRRAFRGHHCDDSP